MTPRANVEREYKLDVGLHFSLPDLDGVLPGVVATALPDAKLQATYIDTSDLRLMRWGVTLRYRRDLVAGGSGESGWTLKLPSDADGVAIVRTELSWPGKLGPVPEEVASLVRAQARTAPLGQVARLLTQRRRVELRDETGHKLAELDDDVVSVMDGRRLAARFRQVELEVQQTASEVLVVEVLNRLTLAGAVAGDDRPKVVRALGPRASLGPDVVVPALGPKATVAAVVAAAIAAALTRIVHHDPGVRLGDDPEHVHQARVGTRRLRSDIRTFRQLLDPDWAGPIRADLGWLGAALGEVRDADVLTGRLRHQLRTLPPADARPAAALLRRLAIQRDRARSRMLEALDSRRYVILLEDLARAAADPPLVRRDVVSAVAKPQGNAAGHSAGPSTVMVLDDGVAVPLGGAVVDPASGPVPIALGGGVPPPEVSAHAVVARFGPAGVAGSHHGDEGATAELGTRLTARFMDGISEREMDAPDKADEHPASHFPPSDLLAVPLGEQRAADVLPGLVHRPWKQLHRAVEALGDDPPDEALHQVRILAKRVRYAAEAVAAVVGKPARGLAMAVAEVQGVLGDMQDAVVAETWLRQQVVTHRSTAQAMVAGELVTVQRQRQTACREGWKGPWKAASRKGLRAWIKG